MYPRKPVGLLEREDYKVVGAKVTRRPSAISGTPISAEKDALHRRLQEARFARRMRFLAACAVVVLGLGGGLWWYLATTGSPSTQEPLIGREDAPKQEAPAPLPGPQAPQRQEPAPEQAFQVALLDLRYLGTMRSGQGQEVPRDVPVLPAQRLDLTVYLPIGSEEGEYEIGVARSQGEQPLATAQATVRLVDYIATAKTRHTVPLGPGSYSLELRRGQFAAGYFEVRVE